MSKQVQDAYIVAATRTPIGRSGRGYFRNTRPDDLLVAALRQALAQVPTLDPKAIEDAIVGCSFPEGEQGMNMARAAVVLAGLPHTVAGRNAIATIKAQLVGMRDGGFISQHDYHIAGLIADVVCGGEVDAGTLVTEEYLLALERKHFCGLLDHPKTQERIMGMLQTGKPVRN